MRGTLVVALVFIALGCAQGETTGHADIPDGPVKVPWKTRPPASYCPWGWMCRNVELPTFGGVDVLVVVDDSNSMEDDQESLAAQFPVLIENLLDPAGGHTRGVPVTDLRIGVVSTDLGTGGYGVETCTDPVDGDDAVLRPLPDTSSSWLTYDVPDPSTELIGTMAEHFGLTAQLGIDGCGFEQPLEAGLRALTVQSHPGGPNEGFLRDDSVLLVLWLSDEDDCSVSRGNEGIFDTLDSSLGHLNLRCFHHSYMLYSVQRYVDGLWDIRKDSPWPILLGMIVGVPPGDPACNGFGDEIEGCLDHPQMQLGVDPVSLTRLLPACPVRDIEGEDPADPAVRFVQLAQEFKHHAYVHSICDDDFTPVLDVLSGVVSQVANYTCSGVPVTLEQDEAHPCKCDTSCYAVHILADDGPCPEGTTPWNPDGVGAVRDVLGEDGLPGTACVVPYAGTAKGDCLLGCHDPAQTYEPDGEGWYYTVERGAVACPTVAFTGEYGTPEGASSFVACP